MRIAVVSLSGLFPKAATPADLWRNVLSRTDAASEPPAGRWLLDPDAIRAAGGPHPDKVPSTRACFLGDGDIPVSPETAHLDPLFRLALHLGRTAWAGAKTDALDIYRVGVILGAIALPTETTNALTRSVLGEKLFGTSTPLPRPENRDVVGYPAGIIAEDLSLGGVAYTLDAACASSLYAVKLACDELLAGRADAMLAGGLSRPDSLYTQMGFAQLRALSPSGRCSPFDVNGDGLIVGEGGGVFVLKRLEDALDHGDTIHGVITGIGLSNDIGGGLLAPANEGQLRAMRRAYEVAGVSPDTVDLVECHATGTPVGDAVEFRSLCTLWENAGPRGSKCVIGSVKSTTGHLLTGAGAAALTKVLFALNEKTLPPTANYHRAPESLGIETSPFEVLTSPRSWESSGVRRAAVSAFGFGGINAHMIVEEASVHTSARSATVSVPACEIAVVAVAIREADTPVTADHTWGVDPGGMKSFDAVRMPAGMFRIPPREVEEMLPQQALALLTAREALEAVPSLAGDRADVGVFLGVALDLNTTNFHLRWCALNEAPHLADVASPALNANRTMGALASIAASRVAREFKLGGPSITVSSGSESGLSALSSAVGALERGELRAALVGAVDLADVRERALGGDRPQTAASVTLVTKRLTDARADGDRVIAILKRVSPWICLSPPRAGVNAFGVTGGLLAVADTCREMETRTLESDGRRLTWVRNREQGPRSTKIDTFSIAQADFRPSPITSPQGIFVAEGHSAAEVIDGLDRLHELTYQRDASIETLALRAWQRTGRTHTGGTGLAVSLVARDTAELARLVAVAREHLRRNPDEVIHDPTVRERVFYSPRPLGPEGKLAFVYPGSGNDFVGMARDLALRFPGLLEREDARNLRLADQLLPDLFWAGRGTATVRERIFAQVAVGAFVTEVLVHLGVRPDAVIGYSLGESSALFALRAWPGRDEMLSRMETSTLFVSDLTGACDAARTHWRLSANEAVDWLSVIVDRSPDDVREAMRGLTRVYLQIVNTPRECVIGGQRDSVNELVRRLGATAVDIPQTTTMHCDVLRPVAEAYRDLHRLETNVPDDVRIYSGGLGRSYDLDSESAAEAILAQAIDTIDYPALIEQAHRDGVRIFVEAGPGGSCSRMISAILGDEPHASRSACVAGSDGLAAIMRTLAMLVAERVPVDLSAWFADIAEPRRTNVRDVVEVKVGGNFDLPLSSVPRPIPSVVGPTVREGVAGPLATNRVHPQTAPPATHALADARACDGFVGFLTEQLHATVATEVTRASAHGAYLTLADSLRHSFAQALATQGALLEAMAAMPMGYASPPSPPTPLPLPGGEGRKTALPRSLNRDECMAFAVGRAADALGPMFAHCDDGPTRVRLPDEPLMLVDRITRIEGEPLSMTSGRVVTEHDVLRDGWYLDAGRLPTCITVEAGQADLFLSGWLGIDLVTRGLRVYRLLDACVTFHRALPVAGDVVVYDIRIDGFFRQNETHLFRFRFVGTVNGEPLLTMTDGIAGFFSEAELAAGKGVVHTALQKRKMPGVVTGDESFLPPMTDARYSEAQVDALRSGDLAGCFGERFATLSLRQPLVLPGGKMRLVHRVTEVEPTGGRFGIGRIAAEADIHPDDWFLTCHFVDDQVMPGTLMFECCLHTFRIFLMRLGWVGESGEVVCEPVPGVSSKLKCRGQVTASTKVVTYEVVVKERNYEGTPFAIADAHMYADGKLVVDIENMSVRFSGLTHERLREIWSRPGIESAWAYDRDRILAFALGKPSDAFGERYRVFDDGFIARLPGPPYSFLDGIRTVTGEPWVMKVGTAAVGEYAVPPDEWYFAADRNGRMPFAVLLEIPLQVCGWLSAYMGSALTSSIPLHYRNLGGEAVLHRPVTSSTGALTNRIICTRVASSGGMIIQDFTMTTSDALGVVYEGKTTFGFFSREALAQQVGIREAKVYEATPDEIARAEAFEYPTDPPYPDTMLRMLDRVSLFVADGGPAGLGLIEGTKVVDPGEWFFRAHFYQDPVTPGSLGLEACIQLLKVAAARRYGATAGDTFEVNVGRHQWMYRGQVIPTNRDVRVQATVTECDDERREVTGDGWLLVEGRAIYKMTAFTVRVVGG